MSNYVVVTTVSTHRMRYVVPTDALKRMDIENTDTIALAKTLVNKQQVHEFSQEWLGEQIVDIEVTSQEDMLKLFDSDNDYLKNWTIEKKLDWVNDWLDNQGEK